MFITCPGIREELDGRRLYLPMQYHGGFCRQVIEQGFGLLHKQREVIVHASRRHALADLLIQRIIAGYFGEFGTKGLPKALDGVIIERKFPGREKIDLRDLFAGALGFRIEYADGLHLVIK